MCYAIPGKVKKIEDKKIYIDYFGEERYAHNELDDLSVGDYIYAQGGYAIKRLAKDEAEEILAVWKETFFELQEVDLRLSRMSLKDSKVDKRIRVILDRALEGINLKKEDLLALLNLDDKGQLELLYKTSNFLRQKYLKNACCVHGILEFSNYCNKSCHYCGISTYNKKLSRYRLTKEEIIKHAKEAINTYGFQSLVLQSGEDDHYSIDELCYIVKEIRDSSPSLIFVSFGEVGIEGLEKLYKAGARGLLMRFETSNTNLYEKLHPGCSLDSRLEHLRKAYDLGYLIITGSLIGLPGQTNEDIINDIYLTKELHSEMYSFGPFLQHPETPLKNIATVDEHMMLKVIALARLIDKDAKIPITTAFETLSKDARKKGLMAGANSVMLNVTPLDVRKKYDIYPKRAYIDAKLQSQIDETVGLLRSIGRAP